MMVAHSACGDFFGRHGRPPIREGGNGFTIASLSRRAIDSSASDNSTREITIYREHEPMNHTTGNRVSFEGS